MLDVFRTLFFLPRSQDDGAKRRQKSSASGEGVSQKREVVARGFGRIALANEPSVLQRLRQGNHAAFEEIFTAYYAALTAYAATFVHDDGTAEDLAQDVLLRFWERRDTAAVRGSLGGYLFGAMRNAALNRVRDTRRRHIHGEKWVADVHGAAPSVMSSALEDSGDDAAARIRLVERTAGTLPPRCQEVFILRWRHGLRYTQIAELMGVSVKAVEAQMTIAIRAIRRAVGQSDL